MGFHVIALTGSEGKSRFDAEGQEVFQTSSGVGKDTLAKYLQEEDPRFVPVKLADGLRDSFYLNYKLDWEGKGNKTYEMAPLSESAPHLAASLSHHPHLNSLMCEYSKERLAIDAFLWVDLLFRSFEEGTIPVITDLRQPHELMVLRTFFSTTIVEIIREEGEGLRPRQPVDGLIAGLHSYEAYNDQSEPRLQMTAKGLAAHVLHNRIPKHPYNLLQSIRHYESFRNAYSVKLKDD